jgi:hypothetical protein
MDHYEIEFSGKNLQVDELISQLPELIAKTVVRRGEVFFVQDGKRKARVRQGQFMESSVTFGTKSPQLANLLRYVAGCKGAVDARGIDEITVWALMERDGQINGELSQQEIKLLSEINATYCWSVVTDI